MHYVTIFPNKPNSIPVPITPRETCLTCDPGAFYAASTQHLLSTESLPSLSCLPGEHWGSRASCISCQSGRASKPQSSSFHRGFQWGTYSILWISMVLQEAKYGQIYPNLKISKYLRFLGCSCLLGPAALLGLQAASLLIVRCALLHAASAALPRCPTLTAPMERKKNRD